MPTDKPSGGANGEPTGNDVVNNIPAALVVGGQTLTAGDQGITVDGTSISLGTDVLVVGTKTESFAAIITPVAGSGARPGGNESPPASVNIGDLIMSPFGGIGSSNPPVVATGTPSGISNGTDTINIAVGAAVRVDFKKTMGFWAAIACFWFVLT